MAAGRDFAIESALGPRAELDYRHPEMYRESMPAAMGVVVNLLAALAARDYERVAGCMHYPFGLFRISTVRVVPTREAFLADVPFAWYADQTTFDLPAHIEVAMFDPVRVGIIAAFTRHHADGLLLSRSEMVLGITRNEGRWAIEMASLISRPADQLAVVYQDAIDNALRLGRERTEGYTASDAGLLDSTRQMGTHLTLRPDSDHRFAAVRAGDPAAAFQSRGVRSRLVVTENREGVQGSYNFATFRESAGGGVGGYAYTLSRPDARVVHHNYNKAHVISGYNRYRNDGSLLSETHALTVYTKVRSRWGEAGVIGTVIRHDATNDAR